MIHNTIALSSIRDGRNPSYYVMENTTEHKQSCTLKLEAVDHKTHPPEYSRLSRRTLHLVTDASFAKKLVDTFSAINAMD